MVAALLSTSAARSQAQANVTFHNMMAEPVTVRLDDGQSCDLPPADSEGACELAVAPGAHTLTVDTSGDTLTAHVDIPPGGGEIFLYEDQIAGP